MRQRVDTLRTVEAPEGVELSLRVAGPFPRGFAFVLDVLVRQFVYGTVGVVLSFFGGLGTGAMLILIFLCEWFYPVVFEVRFGGRTPGKRALGLQVLRDDGTPIGWSASLLRNFLLSADLAPIGGMFGLLSSLASPDFKRIGDRVAGTIVVHVDERRRAPKLASVPPLAPPVALHLEEQAALVEFSIRAPGWVEARAIEVGDRLASVTDSSGGEGVQRLLGMAQWVEGAR